MRNASGCFIETFVLIGGGHRCERLHAHCLTIAAAARCGERTRRRSVRSACSPVRDIASACFCYTCVPAAAYRACSVAPRRQCATAADVVGAAVGIGGARPHARRLFLQHAIDAGAHADQHRCRHADVPSPSKAAPMLHHVSLGVRTIEISAAFLRRSAGCAWLCAGVVRSGVRHARPGGRLGRPGGEDCLALKQRQATQCAPGAGFHLAFAATDTSAVDAFSPRGATARRSLQWRTRLATGLWR